jgi:hypothetical protein
MALRRGHSTVTGLRRLAVKIETVAEQCTAAGGRRARTAARNATSNEAGLVVSDGTGLVRRPQINR